MALKNKQEFSSPMDTQNNITNLIFCHISKNILSSNFMSWVVIEGHVASTRVIYVSSFR